MLTQRLKARLPILGKIDQIDVRVELPQIAAQVQASQFGQGGVDHGDVDLLSSRRGKRTKAAVKGKMLRLRCGGAEKVRNSGKKLRAVEYGKYSHVLSSCVSKGRAAT